MSLLRNRAGQSKSQKPRKPLPRSARMLSPGILEITIGKAELVCYFLTCLPSDFGQAFRLEKFSPVEETRGEVYDVCLRGNRRSTCECQGFLAHGHCKHIDSVSELVEAGTLVHQLPPAGPRLAGASSWPRSWSLRASRSSRRARLQVLSRPCGTRRRQWL